MTSNEYRIVFLAKPVNPNFPLTDIHFRLTKSWIRDTLRSPFQENQFLVFIIKLEERRCVIAYGLPPLCCLVLLRSDAPPIDSLWGIPRRRQSVA